MSSNNSTNINLLDLQKKIEHIKQSINAVSFILQTGQTEMNEKQINIVSNFIENTKLNGIVVEWNKGKYIYTFDEVTKIIDNHLKITDDMVVILFQELKNHKEYKIQNMEFIARFYYVYDWV